MKRIAAFVYGIVSYLVFFGTFVYAMGFVGNLLVPKSIDSGREGAFWPSLLVNVALLGLFAVQHSGMARPEFKRWWTKIVPKPIERSTYVLLASLALILLFSLWRPLRAVVWSAESEAARVALWALFASGWGLVLLATFMISHAHLFGVRQVHDYLRARDPADPGFQTPGLYRHMRHPIMTGFLVAFWATPHMTVGHSLFALATTGYILLALKLEERDLVRAHGEKYETYRRRVPMFVPRPARRAADEMRIADGRAAERSEPSTS